METWDSICQKTRLLTWKEPRQCDDQRSESWRLVFC